METTGTVTATKLNFRSSPTANIEHNIIDKLSRGDTVQILETQGDWLKVRVGKQIGFVSSDFVSVKHELPTADDDVSSNISTLTPGPSPVPGKCKFVGEKAVAPDGMPFGKKFKLGVFNFGTTSIRQFVSEHPGRFNGVAPSCLRVMQAVSENEGKLEAINTWDNAFLTFGIFQWTAGTGSGPGELPALIARLKQTDADVFQKYFGQFGLDTSVTSSPSGKLPVGFFTLNGKILETPAQKEHLRTLDWAYRFWLSGHDDTVRQVQIEQAIDRLNLFYRSERCKIGTRFVADYASSEYGVALLLDQHVNRPGHVPGTFSRAVTALIEQLGTDDPETWNDEQEQKLLDLYIKLRAQTNMTDSTKRAETIRKAIRDKLASDRRGSYMASTTKATESFSNQTAHIHVIVKGQTLSKIAERYNLKINALLAANPHISDKDRIIAGQKIKIPTAAAHTLVMPEPINAAPSIYPSVSSGMPKTNGMTETQKYDLYAPYFARYGVKLAETALKTRVILGLRVTSSTKVNQGQGEYNDRIIVAWQNDDGGKCLKEFEANTEPSARYEDESGEDANKDRRPDLGCLPDGLFIFKKDKSPRFGNVLRPLNDIYVVRDVDHDGDFDSMDKAASVEKLLNSGKTILFHRGGQNFTGSAGCQTMLSANFNNFWKSLGNQKQFQYVLATIS
jgi:LysM repeat protein